MMMVIILILIKLKTEKRKQKTLQKQLSTAIGLTCTNKTHRGKNTHYFVFLITSRSAKLIHLRLKYIYEGRARRVDAHNPLLFFPLLFHIFFRLLLPLPPLETTCWLIVSYILVTYTSIIILPIFLLGFYLCGVCLLM